jgi:hypothetical protein
MTSAPIPVGGSGHIAVSFTPAEIGPISATLELMDNAVDSPQAFALSGIGVPAANLSVGIAAPSWVRSGEELSYTVTIHKVLPVCCHFRR